jgi:tRNA pseudouridine55 synthase
MTAGPPEGLLLVDKPGGPTSHDVVARIRLLLRPARAGHTGTLDPAATGLLPVALGRATRLIRFLPHAPKVYVGRIRLGLTTSTDDLAGEILDRSELAIPGPERVLACAARLLGRSLQVPPAVSARKIGGERMYRLARAGKTVEAAPTEIEVSRFDLVPEGDPADWSFLAEVSAGTYVRALARDLGQALGCGGAIAELRRTAIGSLSIRDAVALPAHGEVAGHRLLAAIIPLDALPLALPDAVVHGTVAARRFLSGLPATADRVVRDDCGACRVLDDSGRLLGVGEPDGHLVRPRVVIENLPPEDPGPVPA